MPEPRLQDGRSKVTRLMPDQAPEAVHRAVEDGYSATAWGGSDPEHFADFVQGKLDFSTLPDTTEAIPYLVAQAMMARINYVEENLREDLRRDVLVTALMASFATKGMLSGSELSDSTSLDIATTPARSTEKVLPAPLPTPLSDARIRRARQERSERQRRADEDLRG